MKNPNHREESDSLFSRLIPFIVFFAGATMAVGQTGLTTPSINTSHPSGSPIATKPPLKPKLAKHVVRHKIMGLSSADEPEKYVRSVMVEIPIDTYEKKYGRALNHSCHLDGMENIYLDFPTAVVKFDKTGKELKFLKNINWMLWHFLRFWLTKVDVCSLLQTAIKI